MAVAEQTRRANGAHCCGSNHVGARWVCTPATWVTRGAQVCGRAFTHTFRWGPWLWFGVWIDSADFLTFTGLGGADASWFHNRSGGKRKASVIWRVTVFCPMSITWAEVEFLFSWKCLPHRSFCIVGELTLPSLISFFKATVIIFFVSRHLKTPKATRLGEKKIIWAKKKKSPDPHKLKHF